MIICLCATRNMYPQLYTSITMLLKTQANLKYIYAFVEDDIETELNDDKVKFINISNYKPITLNLANGKTYFTYMSMTRCYFPELLPNENKIIYLDLDIIIEQDISKLWEIDLEECEIAGVIDKNIRKYRLPYIKHPIAYINSGVLIMNLELLRKNQSTQKMQELLHTWYLQFPDQDALNLTCSIKYLDNKWNSSDVTGISDEPIINHIISVKPWYPNSEWFTKWLNNYLEINNYLDITHNIIDEQSTKYGFSFPLGKKEVKNFLKNLLKPKDKILDVGAGSGTYYFLLGKKYNWTGIEIWHKSANYLKDKYNIIYECDIRNFNYPENYNLVIFGDIIEHLNVSDAQQVLKEAQLHTNKILVAVPYQLPQDTLHGNEAEKHLQSDLTREIFNERYPGFSLIYEIPDKYGYFYWNKEDNKNEGD